MWSGVVESGFRAPVRGGVWSLTTGPGLGGGERVGLLVSRGGSRPPGSWGSQEWLLRPQARGLLVLTFRYVGGSPASDSLTLSLALSSLKAGYRSLTQERASQISLSRRLPAAGPPQVSTEPSPESPPHQQHPNLSLPAVTTLFPHSRHPSLLPALGRQPKGINTEHLFSLLLD